MTTHLSQATLHELEKDYTLQQPEVIYGFLEQHPELVSLVLEASRVLETYFPYTLKVLKVVVDPEEGDTQLVIFVETRLAPEDALTHLDRFDDAWWLEASDRAQGLLSINLEFKE